MTQFQESGHAAIRYHLNCTWTWWVTISFTKKKLGGDDGWRWPGNLNSPFWRKKKWILRRKSLWDPYFHENSALDRKSLLRPPPQSNPHREWQRICTTTDSSFPNPLRIPLLKFKAKGMHNILRGSYAKRRRKCSSFLVGHILLFMRVALKWAKAAC